MQLIVTSLAPVPRDPSPGMPRVGGGAVAALPLAAAAAGARVVAPAPRVLRGVAAHQLAGCPARAQQRGHGLHRLGDVVEEVFVARAQVVLTGLTVGRGLVFDDPATT